jgi:protein-glutamine gamma-glutamyltransferase
MAQLRIFWEATNNSWNQWVLNYTQGRQLNLLQNLGFESPSWEDLSYILIAILVLAALTGAGWTLWERAQHDPWVRLLARARKRLDKAGIPSTPASSPRQLAQEVLARYGQQPGSTAQALADWLLRLEQQRYAAAPAGAEKTPPQLQALREEFRQLAWPA